MMRTINGEQNEPLDLTTSLTVNGGVTGPVLVREGGHLVVNGMLSGEVRVLGEGSFLTVNGEFAADVAENEGLILVAGHLATEPEKIPGRLVVAVDSLVVDQRLLSDGSLEPLRQDGDNSMNPQGAPDNFRVWNRTERRFVNFNGN